MSVRSTLVTAISIPTSVLITFVGLQAFGYSLNILTLGALTIAIGRVVDDSIVVIENIKRHYVGDADKIPTIVRAVREVAAAITASTITSVAVFLPIAFVGDVTGELFRPFSLTVTIAMAASLLVSLTIVPVLASWFLKPGKVIRDAEGNPIDPESPTAPPSRLQKAYVPVLRWTLKHSWVTLTLAVLVLGGTLASVPLLKTDFLGDSGQNTFTVTQKIGSAPSLDAEDAAAQKVEAVLLDTDGVQTVQTSIGSSGSALRDAFSGGGSGITYSITSPPASTRSSSATASAPRSRRFPTRARSRSRLRRADSARPASPSTSPPPTDSRCSRRATPWSRGCRGETASARSPAASRHPSPSSPCASTATRPPSAGCPSAPWGPRLGERSSRGRRARENRRARGDRVRRHANPPKTIDDLRALEIPSARGNVRLDQIATVEQSQTSAVDLDLAGLRTATITVTRRPTTWAVRRPASPRPSPTPRCRRGPPRRWAVR